MSRTVDALEALKPKLESLDEEVKVFLSLGALEIVRTVKALLTVPMTPENVEALKGVFLALGTTFADTVELMGQQDFTVQVPNVPGTTTIQ